jgi:hypothetical protein
MQSKLQEWTLVGGCLFKYYITLIDNFTTYACTFGLIFVLMDLFLYIEWNDSFKL